jgi:aspartyl-tRNA(Asn)/glutamyl-tRNA(Gln) amidotransferase subunit C
MAQRLGGDDVQRIAALARLALTPDEVDRFSRQLGEILAYANEVQALDTTGVEPTSHPLAAAAAWREDTLVPSLDRDTVLAEAPGASRQAGLFRVPKVL